MSNDIETLKKKLEDTLRLCMQEPVRRAKLLTVLQRDLEALKAAVGEQDKSYQSFYHRVERQRQQEREHQQQYERRQSVSKEDKSGKDVAALKKALEDTFSQLAAEKRPADRLILFKVAQDQLVKLKQTVGDQDKNYQTFSYRLSRERRRQQEQEQQQQSRTAAQPASPQVPSAQSQPAVPSEQQTNATAGRPSDMGKPESPASGEASPGMPGQPAAAAPGETSASSSHTDAPDGIDTPPAITDGADSSAAPDPQAPPFEQALAQLRQFQRYAIGEKLQEGNFSIGYRATDRQSGAAVVIKLPGPATWNARFAEAARALTTESAILMEVNSLVPPDGAPDCARVVHQLEHGTLRVANWEHPVPYSVQSFARGTRLSDAEEKLLPFQGSNEPDGVHLLLQLTGLLQHLYAAHLVHNDLRPDALFWDAAAHQVEVIDWNSALRTADPQARSKEFTFNLQTLICELFLNIQRIEHAQGVAFALFATHQGRHLSRGVRLLLARLLDPAFQVNRLADVAALHTAVGELAADWAAAADPVSSKTTDHTPAALSRLLTRQELALRILSVTGQAPVEREEWFQQALKSAEKLVADNLLTWISRPESMRAGMPRIEQIWCWLPDVWPLLWVVPLARAWFATSETTRYDQGLAALVQALLQRNWSALQQQFTSLAQQQVPNEVSGHFTHIQAVAQAYEKLARLEDLLRQTRWQDDQIKQMGLLLREVQEALPLERQFARLEQRIFERVRIQEQVEALRAELIALRDKTPDIANQQQQLRLLQKLHQFDAISVEEVTAQQQRVDRLEQAAAAGRQAATRLADDDWAGARAELADWPQDQTLPADAPELARWIATLQEQVHTQAIYAPFRYHHQLILQALADDNLSGAVNAARQASDYAEQEQLPSAMRMEAQRLAAELEQINTRYRQALAGQYAAAAAIPAPDPAAVPPEVWRFHQELAAVIQSGQRLAAAAENAQALYEVWQTARQRSEAEATHAPLRPLWEALAQQAGQMLPGAVTAEVRNAQDTAEGLPHPLAWYDQVIRALEPQIGDQADLQYTRIMLQNYANSQRSRERDNHLQALTAEMQHLQEYITALDKKIDGLDRKVTATPAPEKNLSSASVRSVAPARTKLSRLTSVRWLWGVVAGVILLLMGTAGGFWLAGRGSSELEAENSTSIGDRSLATSTPAAIVVADVTPSISLELAVSATAAPDLTATVVLHTTGSPPPATPDLTAEPFSPDNSDTVTVTPTLLVAAAQPLTLTAASELEAVANVTLTVLEQRVPLTITRQLTDSLLLELPPNPWAGLEITTPVTLPLTTLLAPGAPFDPLPLTLGDPGLEVTVRGDDRLAEEPGLYYSFVDADNLIAGYYFWQTPDVAQSSPPDDAVRTQHDAGFLLISPGDRLQILAIQDDHYQVQVVSNQADNDADYVLGQEGWLLRRIVDGGS